MRVSRPIFLYFSLHMRTEILFTFVPCCTRCFLPLTAQSLPFSLRFCFQATRDRGLNAEYASSMYMWIAKRKWGAASPNRDSFADRNLRQRLKLAFRSLYRTKKVSISHSTIAREQSSEQTREHCRDNSVTAFRIADLFTFMLFLIGELFLIS